MKQLMIIVSGKVQGVWFRASTQKVAQQLGLTGYVRNVSDGRVEILAQGGAPAVDKLLAWSEQGPEQARVVSVSKSLYEGNDVFLDFQILE